MGSRNTTPHTSAPRLVAAKAASRQSGIPYGSLRDLAHRGELPVIRVGRAWYFDRGDIDRWIETRKERAG
jgi:excisionase family DNA binding protein